MSFTPQFLDELRSRVGLASIVGRRVRLTRRGREHTGLCPFHKEKTPSFHVVEDKGFYHCFGCGAHGDAIGFLMQTGNLSFPEAVEQLAAEAGMEVPKETPQERARAERQSTLTQAMEAAAVFFAETLFRPAGAAGLAYLRGRGLDDAAIRRFRLGFAPESRDALKRALGGGAFPEALLIEGGLLRKPEDGRDVFDYFRNRVIFPIGDRSGRVIAFGGRIIGEGQPKYLNSPESPIFHKGRTLYGWAAARAAAARTAPPSAIVTEGYMDVIALHRAGFETAVAPLGTALTEEQIEEVWKLAPEPVLCFDGDAAGMRAAVRGLLRALPLLKPGYSLRFATLPQGEDPDSLTLRQGPDAMRAVLDGARPMAEMLWSLEWAAAGGGSGGPATPERRAAFEHRLEERVRTIADRTVQEHYRRFMRERLYQTFRPQRAAFRGAGGAAGRPSRPGFAGRSGGAHGRPGWLPAVLPAVTRPDPEAVSRRRQQEILFAAVLNHPNLIEHFVEDLAALELSAPDLDRLRAEILNTAAGRSDLDAAALRVHLTDRGLSEIVDAILSRQVDDHAAFARPGVDAEEVRRGWMHTLTWLYAPQRQLELNQAERDLADDMTEEKLARLMLLQKQRLDGTSEEPLE
ncbi:MAG TPA: DNA primase [Stellaceae bacterium]